MLSCRSCRSCRSCSRGITDQLNLLDFPLCSFVRTWCPLWLIKIFKHEVTRS
jgi:hypothetical protein